MMARCLVRGLLFGVALPVELVCLAASAGATTFTVGAGGTHASVQAAVNAALAAGGDHEIRIRQGSFPERLNVPATFSGGLSVSGGWDAAFATRSEDAGLTVIAAAGLGRPLAVDVTAGTLRFEGLTLSGGLADHGGGVRARLRGSASLVLANVRIVDNAAAGAEAKGGGVYAELSGSSRLTIEDSQVADNLAEGAEVVEAGGLFVGCAESSHFSLLRSSVERNRAASTDESGRGAGLTVICFGAGSATIDDNLLADNEAVGSGQSFGYGVALSLLAADESPPTGEVVARRNRILGNQYSDEAAFADHVTLAVQGAEAAIVLSDSVVAGGSAGGVGASAVDGGVVRLTNLTVAGHQQLGVFDYRLAGGAAPAGTVSLFNTIVFGNGTDTDLTSFVVRGSNLVGVDPRFVAPELADYRLEDGSPAIDAGTNTPPGGLGSTDVERRTRVTGGKVDIGAHEFGSPPPPSCVPGPTRLCLAGGRFAVEMDWATASASGTGQAVALTPDTGTFWFFGAANVEVVVKVLDACAGFDRFWVFAAGLTNVEVEWTVRDTVTAAERTYRNARGTPFAPLQDTGAFATCP
jgi:hypothetical protein